MNQQNQFGETPLHKTVLNRQLLLILVNQLMDAKADVNATTSRGETVLQFAVRAGRLDFVKRLTQAGADVSQRGAEGLDAYQLV